MTREEMYEIVTFDDETEREARINEYAERDIRLQRDYDDRVNEVERLKEERDAQDERASKLEKDLEVYKERVRKLSNATPIEKQKDSFDMDIETLQQKFYE